MTPITKHRRSTSVAPVTRACALAAALALSSAASAASLTNQEFAAQVRAWRGEYKGNESAVGQAALLCANLPAHRFAEEPQCLALQLHFRTQAKRKAEESAGLFESAKSAAASILSSLTGKSDDAA